MTPLYDVISVWPYIGDGTNEFPLAQCRARDGAAREERPSHVSLDPRPALAHAGDEERRPADVAGHACHDRSFSKGRSPPSSHDCRGRFRADLGHHSGRNAVTGARVHRRPERARRPRRRLGISAISDDFSLRFSATRNSRPPGPTNLSFRLAAAALACHFERQLQLANPVRAGAAEVFMPNLGMTAPKMGIWAVTQLSKSPQPRLRLR